MELKIMANQLNYSIPIVNTPQMSLNFGRMESDLMVVDHELQIENQSILSGRTFNQLQTISSIELSMTSDDFQRVWRTLLLRRGQDVNEFAKGVRPTSLIDIPKVILLPAPLADTLSQIGNYNSNATGHNHHVTIPNKPKKDPPSFWSIDDDLFDDWSNMCGRLQHHYVMKAFPEQSESNARPLLLTKLEVERVPAAANAAPEDVPDATGYYRVKSYTNETSPTDALIRMINEDLFVERAEWTAASSHLYMTPRLRRAQIVSAYVGSYVLDSNS